MRKQSKHYNLLVYLALPLIAVLSWPIAVKGAAAAVRLFEQNQAQPLALAAGDFDEDGVPDLLSSYGGPGGLLTLYRGNADLLHPYSPAAQQRRVSGQFTDAVFL